MSFTSVMFFRRRLWGGFLARSLFPLIVDPARSKACYVLPCRYWPEELLEYWAEGGEA